MCERWSLIGRVAGEAPYVGWQSWLAVTAELGRGVGVVGREPWDHRQLRAELFRVFGQDHAPPPLPNILPLAVDAEAVAVREADPERASWGVWNASGWTLLDGDGGDRGAGLLPNDRSMSGS